MELVIFTGVKMMSSRHPMYSSTKSSRECVGQYIEKEHLHTRNTEISMLSMQIYIMVNLRQQSSIFFLFFLPHFYTLWENSFAHALWANWSLRIISPDYKFPNHGGRLVKRVAVKNKRFPIKIWL